MISGFRATPRFACLALLPAAFALLLASAAAAAVPPAVAAAIADPARPAVDRENDAKRAPAAVLEASRIGKGWKVADLMQGSGYYTRLFVSAAGPKGHVYAWSPPEFIAAKKTLYGDSLDVLTHDYPQQLTALRMGFDDLAFPEPLDLVFQSQNYHDLHMKVFPADRAAKLNTAVFKALKPGGVYLIVDHVANAGDAAAPDRVHRGDPAAMRTEVEAAGFVFDGENSGLRNAADDHSKHVFDPTLRGHTDQVIYRFRKPR